MKISSLRVSQYYVTLKFSFSAKSSGSYDDLEVRFVNNVKRAAMITRRYANSQCSSRPQQPQPTRCNSGQRGDHYHFNPLNDTELGTQSFFKPAIHKSCSAEIFVISRRLFLRKPHGWYSNKSGSTPSILRSDTFYYSRYRSYTS
jgi:hypothetical protein